MKKNLVFFIFSFLFLLSCKDEIVSPEPSEPVEPERPVACFEYIPCSEDICIFEFDASCTEGDATYMWDFGDGNTAEGQKVSYAYKEYGTYNVQLRVQAASGAIDITFQILEYYAELDTGTYVGIETYIHSWLDTVIYDTIDCKEEVFYIHDTTISQREFSVSMNEDVVLIPNIEGRDISFQYNKGQYTYSDEDSDYYTHAYYGAKRTYDVQFFPANDSIVIISYEEYPSTYTSPYWPPVPTWSIYTAKKVP